MRADSAEPPSSLAAPSGDSWHALFRGDRAAVVARIASGDPLELCARCAVRVRERYVLLDVDRLYIYAIARLAEHGEPHTGSALDAWLEERIDDAIAELLREDWHEEFTLRLSCVPGDERYALLTRGFGIAPKHARRVAVRFNGLAESCRRAFFAMVIEGWSIERCSAAGFGTRAKVIADVLCAWQAFRDPARDAEPANEISSGG